MYRRKWWDNNNNDVKNRYVKCVFIPTKNSGIFFKISIITLHVLSNAPVDRFTLRLYTIVELKRFPHWIERNKYCNNVEFISVQLTTIYSFRLKYFELETIVFIDHSSRLKWMSNMNILSSSIELYYSS